MVLPCRSRPSWRRTPPARHRSWRVVVLGGESTHGIEHDAEAPVLRLTCAAEDDVRLAQLDLLHAHTDAVRAGGASGGDRVGDALKLEGGREYSRHRRAHRARHPV